MKVKMKEYEKLCRDYAEKWNKQQTWEMYCIAKDSWLEGFNMARQLMADHAYISAAKLCEEEVEVEIESNQIGMTSS